MIYNAHATPEDLRIVDPRPRPWNDEKAARVVAARLVIRFGPGSDIAQMLGLASSAAEESTRERMTRLGAVRVGDHWEYRCVSCGAVKQIRKQVWSGDKVCRACKRTADLIRYRTARAEALR